MKYAAPLVALAIATLSLAGAAQAHHSAAMYDAANPIEISGTVKAVRWVNPHVQVDVAVDAANGAQARTWQLEASSPGVMTRAGWSKRTLNPGDKVTFLVHPHRSGEASGIFRRVTLPSGKTLVWLMNAGEKTLP